MKVTMTVRVTEMAMTKSIKMGREKETRKKTKRRNQKLLILPLMVDI